MVPTNKAVHNNKKLKQNLYIYTLKEDLPYLFHQRLESVYGGSFKCVLEDFQSDESP